MKKQVKNQSLKTDKTVVRSFRFHKDSYKGLQDLTKKVNSSLNINVSMNSIVEILIKEAIQQGEGRIQKLINKT
jgi:hypothetical protein